MNVNGLVPSVFNELIILGTNFIAPLAFYVTPLSTTVINGDMQDTSISALFSYAAWDEEYLTGERTTLNTDLNSISKNCL